MTLTLASLCIGMLLTGGLLLVLNALRTPQPDLGAALAVLSNDTATLSTDEELFGGASFPERIGGWLLRHTPLRPNTRQRSLLRLSGTSHAEFYGVRALYSLVFAAAPWFLQAVFVMFGLTSASVALPAAATLALAALGWFLPSLSLAQRQEAVSDDTVEAFGVLLDLVVLERVANASAIDAITRAAFVSNAPLFVQVQQTLNRADLENVQPWSALRALADEIQLPELIDLVSIAQLQSEGASLAPTLRARTSELRNAYLLRMQKENTRITQRMAIAKMLPPMSIVALLLGAMLLNILLQV